MSELGSIKPWRLREKIEFGTNKQVELDNGNLIEDFVIDFSRNASRYRISDRYLFSNNGLTEQDNLVFAVRHLNNKEYDNYIARWKGDLYKITNIVYDDTKLVTYDLISLRSYKKNG